MSHTVQKPNPPFLALDGAIEVHQVPAATDNLCWILVCTATREAAVIDGPSAKEVLAYLEGRDIRWTTILNTHTHGDHVGINADLQKRGMLESFVVVGPEAVRSAVPGITRGVGEGDVVQIGSATGTVWVTEGHLNGHVSYLFGDVLFCGDTLFTGGCGYLFDGPPTLMFESLMRLSSLSDDTKICCAHEYTQDNLRFAWMVEPGNSALQERIRRVWQIREDGGCAVPSTMGEERATNPFLRPGSPAIQHQLAQVMSDHPQDSFADIFAATRAWKDQKPHRAVSDETLLSQ